MGNTVVEDVKDAGNAIADKVEDVVDAVGELGHSAWDHVEEFGDSVVDKVEDVGDKLKPSNILAKVKGEAEHLLDDVEEVGKSVKKKLIAAGVLTGLLIYLAYPSGKQAVKAVKDQTMELAKQAAPYAPLLLL
jgi:isocitrate dehydrogenase kinase/phosphatase